MSRRAPRPGRAPAPAVLGALALLLAGCAEGEGPHLPKMPEMSLPEVSLPRLGLPDFGWGKAETPAVVAEARPPAGAADALPPPQAPGAPVDRSVAIATTSREVPTVYLALETPPGGPVSMVFAIDSSNDATPDDEPAIRLTPERGHCNPQELSRYRFRGDDARPVFGRLQAVRGVGPAELPAYMATQVSARMIDVGLAATPDETKPQNVCARKLWETLVLASSEAAARPSGQ